MKIVIIGAGASGLFCAGLLSQNGIPVTVIDAGTRPGRKVLASGGGKCNFTNLNVGAENYVSYNPHFCKSALSRYKPGDFIKLLERYSISYHEREQGRLFCDGSSVDIVKMLINECCRNHVTFCMGKQVLSVESSDGRFTLNCGSEEIAADILIIAAGGLTLPELASTSIGYKTAERFDIPVIPVRAGLVPLTLDKPQREIFSKLAGVSLIAQISLENGISFRDKLLFTHRGLSGPVVLQISNYWTPGQWLTLDLLPDTDIEDRLKKESIKSPKQSLKSALSCMIPKSLADCLIQTDLINDMPLGKMSIAYREEISKSLHNYRIKPCGTEGYRTAEVTLGGVDTRYLSSKTMESTVAGLYFIGEVTDVTGWLGGYNLQWCWSSAYACAEAVVKGYF